MHAHRPRRDARPPPASRWATAFAPGHVTGLFAPDLGASDPRGRGSIGAGVVLSLGAHAVAAWSSGPRRLRVVDSAGRRLPISEEVVRRLAPPAGGAVAVTVHHDLPVGQGFGMSASGALAAGLAVSRLFGLPRRRAVEVAHLADLFGGGGLGGVAAILGGGWERRIRAGLPPWGFVRRGTFPGTVFLVIAGPPMPSPPLLRDPRFLRRVHRAASAGLHRLGLDPSPRRLLEESERFTDAMALGPPTVARVSRRLRAAGAFAAQTMFGQCLWVVPRRTGDRDRVVAALEREGLPTVEVAAARGGPRASRAGSDPMRASVLNRALLARLP